MVKPKIIVLDDDPTGSQTVHSCLLLTRWDVETLVLGLRDAAPIFFVLTNTRALAPEAAAERVRSVCRHLKQALQLAPQEHWILVSRSDSTLRGHYPLETDVMAAELGPFDAHLLIPAFLEGGRITRDSVHYLIIDGVPTPVHETEFARDSVFAYHHSYLPDYVAEKTRGGIPAERVERLTLDQIRRGCRERLLALSGNVCGVVDAETPEDLRQFARDLVAASQGGKRFLLRSAASILTALADLPPQPLPADAMAQLRPYPDHPGAVIVGSHVGKTTLQLQDLLQQPGIEGIEVEVQRLLDPGGGEPLLGEVNARVQAAFQAGLTPVVYTSRRELSFPTQQERLDFGQRVSNFLMQVEQHLPAAISFLISKGGITSNDTLSHGLGLAAVRLQGQILPGVSVVLTPADHPRFPKLPVVLFPGNVGDAQALSTVYHRLTQPPA
ncbi:MAG: four-carbon acid sugar kinase family protein [Thermostichales cyanobacterium BF3_bins_165]